MEITHNIHSVKSPKTIIKIMEKRTFSYPDDTAVIIVQSTGNSTKQAAQEMVKHLNESVNMLKEMKEAIEREFLN